MKVYKIRHKETGLFYQTITGRWAGTKSNLSKNGKIYSIKPPEDLNNICGVYVSSSLLKKYDLKCNDSWDKGQYVLDKKDNQFEIVTYNLEEVKESNE